MWRWLEHGNWSQVYSCEHDASSAFSHDTWNYSLGVQPLIASFITAGLTTVLQARWILCIVSFLPWSFKPGCLVWQSKLGHTHGVTHLYFCISIVSQWNVLKIVKVPLFSLHLLLQAVETNLASKDSHWVYANEVSPSTNPCDIFIGLNANLCQFTSVNTDTGTLQSHIQTHENWHRSHGYWAFAWFCVLPLFVDVPSFSVPVLCVTLN